MPIIGASKKLKDELARLTKENAELLARMDHEEKVRRAIWRSHQRAIPLVDAAVEMKRAVKSRNPVKCGMAAFNMLKAGVNYED